MTWGCPSCTSCWQKAGTRSISEASTTATVAVSESAATASVLCSDFCCFWVRLWVFRWFLRFETVLKVFPHSPQTCGRSPVCVRRCSARCMLCTKPLSQNSHRNGRSPECVRRCSRRCVFWRNRFPQIAQGYGRSPVCTLWCSVTWCRRRFAGEFNRLPQIVQSRLGFAIEGVLSCSVLSIEPC
uniref:Uncharacterized protein n=1 Tax=Cyprinus carpio TaxID=7962 RepID=A0A8C1Z5I5_CYPCA